MAKALKTAALVVGAVALVATGVGAAIGAAAAASTVVAAGVSVATIATVASVAAGVLSLAAGLTAKKPTATATGSQEQFSADPDAGIPLALGRTGTAGNIGFRRGWDTRDAGDNDRQAFVSILSLGPIGAVEGMTVDKVPTFFGGTGAAIGAFAGFMWSMTQLGALPEPAALGFGAGAGTPPGWTAQHKLSGLAAASWTLRFDTKAKVFQNGVPAPMWTVRGALAYDPTKDSTYPGGSGPHRMADPADTAAYDAAVATWEWTEDPYLLGLRWAHGFWQRDNSVAGSTYQRVMGMGAPWTGIDVAAFVEGRNIARANGWTCGGIIFSGDDKWASMKKILQAGMGEPLALGAKISCLVNAPKVSLATITIDDVIGEASVSATQPRRDRVNTITPRYRLEANNWQLLPGSPISVAAHVAEDRGKRSKVLDYPFIQNTPQVGTAVRYDIENAREFGPIVLPLKLVWMGYKPGDCVTANLPEVGLNNQPILLLNRDLDPSAGITTMTARSETAAKHAFALGQTATPPPTPGVTGPMLIPVPGAAAWTISGTSIVSDGAETPALIVTGAVDAGSAEAIVVEYRLFIDGQAADAGWIGAGVFEPSLTRQQITSVRGGTAYEVAISYRKQGFTGDRRIVGPVVTGGSKLDYSGVTGPTRPDNNATNSADPNSPFGGSTVKDALLKLGQVPGMAKDLEDLAQGAVKTDEALAALTDAGVSRDAAQRLLGRGTDMLAEAALRLTLDANRQREMSRDAGMVIDPASGKARIFAAEDALARSVKLEVSLDAQAGLIRNRATYTDLEMAIAEAQLEGKDINLSGLYGRVSDSETRIDALDGEIVNRATTAELNELGLTVSEVEQRLDSFGDEIGISTDIRKVRRATDEAARAILGGLISQDRAGRADRDLIVQARQELTARMDAGDAIEARARTQLGVAIGDVDARLVEESRARIAAGEVTAEAIRSLSAASDDQAGLIGDLSQVSIDQSRGLTVTRTTQRQQAALNDQTAEALLTSLIAGDQMDRRAQAQMVQVQSEQTTELVREKLSRAAERVALDAKVADTAATAARSSEALAEVDRAAARTVAELTAQIVDPVTGLAAAHADIGKVESAVAKLDGATARSIETLSADLGEQSGKVSDLREVVVGPEGSAVRAMTVLDAKGRISGVQQTNDGTIATFGVSADVFGVYHPVTGALLFYVDMDGAVVGKLKARSVTADNIVPGSVLRVSVKVLESPVVIPWG